MKFAGEKSWSGHEQTREDEIRQFCESTWFCLLLIESELLWKELNTTLAQALAACTWRVITSTSIYNSILDWISILSVDG